MARIFKAPLSGYASEAVRLLGQRIRMARIERKLTAEELAERAGISRGLVQRIEQGSPGCSIGAVFEAATIVGVPLFEPDRDRLASTARETSHTLSLLPKSVRPGRVELKDDF